MNGADVRKIRKLSKLTQVEFASKIGISRELLTGIENDKFTVSRSTQYALEEYVKSLKNPQNKSDAILAMLDAIEADFYSLKHSNADDIAQLYGLAAAQGFIGHASEKVTRIYATGQGERDLDAMKRIDNKFSE